MSESGRERAGGLVRRTRDWRTDPLLERFRATPLGNLLDRLLEVQVRDRALGLAGQAFIALVPVVIVLATWLSSTDGAAVGDWLVRHFSLEGSAAEAVDQLFARPPDASSGVSLLGLLILLVSVNSFARLLQRTFELAWRLPQRAPRRTPQRLLSLLVLVALLVGVAVVTGLVGGLPTGRVLSVVAQLAVAIPCWCLVIRLLLSARIEWALLLPGACLAAVAQVLATWAGALWMPILIERNAGRYGVIGVAVALICWLVVLAFLVVGCAVVGAWAAGLIEERRAARSLSPDPGAR